MGGAAHPYQLPQRPQYYEYLPPDRFGEENIETPLDRFLKQSIKQTYGRFDYVHWRYSDPGRGIVGAPGKKLYSNEGVQVPAFIDPIRATADPREDYPIYSPNMRHDTRNWVLIQTWESNQSELTDTDADGNIWEATDTNDPDIFPRITTNAKQSMLSNPEDVNGIRFSTGTPADPSQVAVLAVGQLLNGNVFDLHDASGFRGVLGLNTSFGALETNFIVVGRSSSSFTFREVPRGLFSTGGSSDTGNAIDPMVIPILVNGNMAPNVYDGNGNLVTDSNNYYLVYNVDKGYTATIESEAWGVTPSVIYTLHENPGRLRLSSIFGFRYFDYREKFNQRGTFSNGADATLDYENVLGADSLTSTIYSGTTNLIYGPQAGLRAEIGDERWSFGVDANFLLGANTHNAVVAVEDLLYAGDDNFSKHSSTYMTAGLELLLDTKVRLTNHISLTVGYNLLWFNSVTRPMNNVHYNINAVQVEDSPEFDYSNDVRVDKKRTSVNMNGVSVGILVDW